MVSYGTLNPEGNAQAFLRKSHSTGTCSKTHPVGRAWEIDSHTFRKVWVVLSHQISILWYTLSHGNCMSFTINVPLHEETQKNPSFKSVCSINLSFYGTLHQMNGTQIFAWNPHNIAKFSETLYHVGRTWNANSRTIFKIWVIFLPSNFCPMGYSKKTISTNSWDNKSPSPCNFHWMSLKVFCYSSSIAWNKKNFWKLPCPQFPIARV